MGKKKTKAPNAQGSRQGQTLTREERQARKSEGFRNYQNQLIENFQSSVLASGGSDSLVFFPPEFNVSDRVWPYLLRKEEDWNHADMRSFINSCLVASSPGNPFAEEVVNKLSSHIGIPRIRFICNSSINVDAGVGNRSVSFQSVVLPFIALLVRNSVRESTLEKQVNIIYSTVYTYMDTIVHDQILRCVDELIRRKSLKDTSTTEQDLLSANAFIPVSYAQILLVLVRFVNEILGRIKEARVNVTLQKIGGRLEQATIAWKDFLSDGLMYGDILSQSDGLGSYCFTVIDKELGKMKKMLDSGRKSLERGEEVTKKMFENVGLNKEAITAAMQLDLCRSYDPPGELSKHGKRHDNDAVNFQEIRVVPTADEILCKRNPFLPSTLPTTPHFLEPGPDRLLDTQFRLVREDMLNPLRIGLHDFLAGLDKDKSQIAKLLEKGGRFKSDKGNRSGGDLNVYTHVKFKDIQVNRNRGFLIRVGFKQPKAIKTKDQRKFYWERSRKLMHGSLICVLWANDYEANQDIAGSKSAFSLYFGVIAERNENVMSENADEAIISVHFIESSIYPIVLEDMALARRLSETGPKHPDRFMVESTGVYFESYVHILKALQDSNPGALPFSRHLAPANEEDLSAELEPPLYARAPGFKFDLSALLDKKAPLTLEPVNELSRHLAVQTLVQSGKLDESQAKALVYSLCREIALIEGPPGTGKTYVGVELMKVLLDESNQKASSVGFTNHALDQFLENLLHVGVKDIVRLGSRSKSEAIKEFALEERSRKQTKSAEHRRMLGAAYSELEALSEEAKGLTERLARKTMEWSDVETLLMIDYSPVYQQLTEGPIDFPSEFIELEEEDSDPNNGYAIDFNKTQINQDDNEGWEYVGGGKGREPRSLFGQWVHGSDIRRKQQTIERLRNIEMEKEKRKQKKGKNKHTENPFEFLQDQDEDTPMLNEEEIESSNNQFWLQTLQVQIPETDRPLDVLLEECSYGSNVWDMSIIERRRLHDHWRKLITEEITEKLAEVVKQHTEKRKEVDDIHDGVRKEILKSAQVIGMTTNGAAKFQSLIRSVSPRIIVCEEAGEVLEAHILAPLNATQHLILIGDHLQLRPHVATYSLSLDSDVGKNYALDRSLFERLVNEKKPMVKLLTQRRMRGEIADLVRDTLYPGLIDHEVTTKYPPVRGTPYNLFFFDHMNPEDAAGSNQFAMQSHSNSFEVKMVVEMVKYFVRNGYDKDGDIAVLTPYLGQMIKIRDALNKQFVVIIDERDNEQIAMMAEEEELAETDSTDEASTSAAIPTALRKSLTRQVTLRTIDNYQGEEATIVIISLVRNISQHSNKATIGFLKSTNRTNVLLSRAKHGMFLLGNANLLFEKAQRDGNKMWPDVINTLRERCQLGSAFPLQCERHTDTINFVEKPEQFSEFAPDGGCQEPCGFTLKCGHVCQYKCHYDDPDHIGVMCYKPCQRLHDSCRHACQKICGEPCGNCTLTINNVELPCGHIKKKAPCYKACDPTTIKCEELIDCVLPRCGHEQKRHCFEAIEDVKCSQKCGMLLKCGHPCSANCEVCQRKSIQASATKQAVLDANGHVTKTNHSPCNQACGRNLYCEHRCANNCHDGRPCQPCKEKCMIRCRHSTCNKKCSQPCNVCAEPCDWQCKHQGKCPLSCGAPCIRLPCNQQCEKFLPCKHRCPGVCGEECVPPEFCPVCAPPDIRKQTSNVAMLEEFGEVDWDINRMIVLECKHAFTMAYLDEQLEMKRYYNGIDGEADFEKIWTKVCTLPNELGSIHRCPLCRRPITNVKRYGRPIKKAILDIQNKKFLSKYRNLLNQYNERVQISISTLETNREKFLGNIKKPILKPNERPTGASKIPEDLDIKELSNLSEFTNLRKGYGIPQDHNDCWIKYTNILIQIYSNLSHLLAETKNPPWKTAFEAAVASLYRSKLLEMDYIIATIRNMGIAENDADSTLLAFQRESLHGVGMVLPVVDRRCYLDIFLILINVQKILFQEVDYIVQALSDNDQDGRSLDTRPGWINFALFILQSTMSHLQTIIKVAHETKYYKQYVTATLELAEVQCRHYRYRFKHRKITEDPNDAIGKAERKKIINELKEILQRFETLVHEIFPILQAEHFQRQCETRMENTIEEINELTNLARGGVLTKTEKLQIFQAMSDDLRGSGHWYTCPNGHTYTIADCGGAVVESRCPDCNAVIGGTGHTLAANNRRNEEFESFTH